MELSNFFEPIDTTIVGFESHRFRPMLGDVIHAYNAPGTFPEPTAPGLVILGINEDRNSADNPGCAAAPDHIRRYLYRLVAPHHEAVLTDLGNIGRGATPADTYTAVSEVMQALLADGHTVIVLGGSDDLVFPIYKAYESLRRVINIAAVDSRFNLEGGDTINSNNYLQHIILQQPNYLFDYVNIGYQTYFVGGEMIKLMDELKFTTHRLGELQSNIEHTEPLVRYCDMVAIDINAVRQSDAPAQAHPSPHGFYGEQLCQIARYAGMSDKTSCIGFFEATPRHDVAGQTAHMLAHAVWFFVEGYCYRQNDFPHRDKQHYKRFIVELSEHGIEIVFYKSLKSDRWWMEVPCTDADRQQRYMRHTLIPCNYADYTRAMNNEIPELWWHYYNRINN